MVTEVEDQLTSVVIEENDILKPVNGLTKRVDGDLFDEWKKLSGHSFTIGFLIESLRANDEEYKKLHGNRPVKDVTSSDISKGKGFVSEVLRCVVSFADSTSESDIYTTVLKIPGTSSMEAVNDDSPLNYNINDNTINKFARVHNTEAEFYNNLICTFEIPHIKVFRTLPWVIGESEGVLHMEDMTGKGDLWEFGLTLNTFQIKEIVRHLAHMHKVCLTSDEKHQKLWKGKYNENQCAFNTFISMCENYEPFLEFCGDTDFFEPLLKKYKKFGSNPDYNQYAFSQSWKDLNIQPVLVHGDLHAANVMWKLDEHDNLTNQLAAIFDWQMIHEGSPMADIGRLLGTSTDGCIRRHAEEFIFQFYYDLLEKEMKEVGKVCPYTVEQLKTTYYCIFLSQCYGAALFTAICRDHLKSGSENVHKAKIDAMVLRCKHLFEDMDKLLTGPMNHVFKKFG